jgi:hypothetical protein
MGEARNAEIVDEARITLGGRVEECILPIIHSSILPSQVVRDYFHTNYSPGDRFAVTQEFTGQRLRRVGSKPDDRIGSFLDRPGGASAAHVGAHPSRANRVHSKVWQGRRQLRGYGIESGLRDAVSWRPAVGSVGQLATAAGDIDNARRATFCQQRREFTRDAQRPERVGFESLADQPVTDRQDRGIAVEEDAGVVHQHVEMIGDFRELARCCGHALRGGNIEMEEGRLHSILRQSVRCRAPGIRISRPYENVKIFRCQLARYLAADAFVGASDECIFHTSQSVLLHEALTRKNHTAQRVL